MEWFRVRGGWVDGCQWWGRTQRFQRSISLTETIIRENAKLLLIICWPYSLGRAGAPPPSPPPPPPEGLLPQPGLAPPPAKFLTHPVTFKNDPSGAKSEKFSACRAIKSIIFRPAGPKNPTGEIKCAPPSWASHPSPRTEGTHPPPPPTRKKLRIRPDIYVSPIRAMWNSYEFFQTSRNAQKSKKISDSWVGNGWKTQNCNFIVM